MGIVNELKYIYDARGNMRKYELNSILAEKISKYINYVCTKEEIKAINEDYGNVSVFAHVLAEDFTRNNGSFNEKEMINEVAAGKIGGKLGGKLFGKLTGKITGKVAGNAAKRFGGKSLNTIARWLRKPVGKLTNKDVGKFIARKYFKNASPDAVKVLEKKSTWLVKNTNMSEAQIVEHLKIHQCPIGRDPKIWDKAWKYEAKNFNGTKNISKNRLVRRYDELAKTMKKTTGKAGSIEAGQQVGSAGGGALEGKVSGSMLSKAGKMFGKAGLGKVAWKLIKWGGIIYLVTAGGKYVYNKAKEIWEKVSDYSNNGDGSYYDRSNLNNVYSKEYGQAYLDANPDDYRL